MSRRMRENEWVTVRLTGEERELLILAMDFFFTAKMRRDGKIPKGARAADESTEAAVDRYLSRWSSELGYKVEAKLNWGMMSQISKEEFLGDLSDRERRSFLEGVEGQASSK